MASNTIPKNHKSAAISNENAEPHADSELVIPRFIANLNALAVDAGLTVRMQRLSEPGSPDRLQGVWSGTSSQLMSMGIWAKSQHLPQRTGSLAVPMNEYGRKYAMLSGTVEIDGDKATYTVDFGFIPESVELVGPVEVTRYHDEIACHGTAEQLVAFGIDRKRLPGAKQNARTSGTYKVPQIFGGRRWPDGTIVHWCESEAATRARLAPAKECSAEIDQSRQNLSSAGDDDLSPATHSTASEWKAEHHHSVRISLACLHPRTPSATSIYGARFRFSQTDVQRINSIIDRFREELHTAIDQGAVIDAEQPARPNFLRLVVDNSGA